MVGQTIGLLVTKRNVPPFIATIEIAILLIGLRLMWTEELPQGKIPPLLVEVGVGTTLGVPNIFFVFFFVAVLISMLLNRIGYGRRLYAVGNNPAVADGVDIKHAHGFFGNEFLQPANTREGRYGGSFENRTRFFREVIEGIKQKVDNGDYLLSVRISAYEGVVGEFGTSGPGEIIEDLSEPIAFARLAQEVGLQFISASAGSAGGNLEILLPTSTFSDGVFRHFGWTRTIKQSISIPVIGAGYCYLRDGRNNLPGENPVKKSFIYWAEKNLRDNSVDLVGIGRQAIADPLLPKKILNGDYKSVNCCIMCMDHGMLLVEQQEVGCSVYNSYYKELVEKLMLKPEFVVQI